MKLATQKIQFTAEIQVGGSSAKVTLNSLSKGEAQALIKKHSKVKFVKGQRTEEVDYFAFAEERFLAILAGWEGVCDTQGQPLSCDLETKKLVYQHNPDFVTAVSEAADEYASRAEALAEEGQKN